MKNFEDLIKIAAELGVPFDLDPELYGKQLTDEAFARMVESLKPVVDTELDSIRRLKNRLNGGK